MSNQQIKLAHENSFVSDRESLGKIIHKNHREMFQQNTVEDEINLNENPLDYVTYAIVDEESVVLSEPIKVDEIKETLKRCNQKKTPGPDGLSNVFYLKHFHLLKEDLCNLLNGYWNGTYNPPKEFSEGIVTLIAKKGDILKTIDR